MIIHFQGHTSTFRRIIRPGHNLLVPRGRQVLVGTTQVAYVIVSKETLSLTAQLLLATFRVRTGFEPEIIASH